MEEKPASLREADTDDKFSNPPLTLSKKTVRIYQKQQHRHPHIAPQACLKKSLPERHKVRF